MSIPFSVLPHRFHHPVPGLWQGTDKTKDGNYYQACVMRTSDWGRATSLRESHSWTWPSDIHHLINQGGRAKGLAGDFNATWQQGQLPGGQTAKARPGQRVQSLHKGHGRHGFH